MDQDTSADEILLDNLNLTMRNLFQMPLTATIGRQDLILGVGWLVFDGTPLDESRTTFTDAARFTFDWMDTSTKLDLIYIDHAAKSDRWLSPIMDRNRALTEQDEYGAIAYLTNTSIEDMRFEGFVMYKNDNAIDGAVNNMPAGWSRKAEIYTVGGAIAGAPGDNWSYRAEAAVQTGDKESSTGEWQDLEAFGALTNLQYAFDDDYENSIHIGYEYASGDDDPDDSKNEQFDLLWGEWSRWSELYIYTYAGETMFAESTNLHRLNVGHTFKPHDMWEISTDYHALWADENSPSTGIFDISTTDRFRGHLFTCWAKYEVSDHLAGHFLAEYFIPGDYYLSTNDDDAYFLRFNVEYTF
jgi:hypothetical protein